MTRLCVSIHVETLPQALRDALSAAEGGADLVELRIDLLQDPEEVRRLVRECPLPCIVTCRPTSEGGLCDLSDQERIPLLEAAALEGASYIDIELASYQRSANLRQKVHFNAGSPLDMTAPREKRSGLIVSAHDFASRPVRLHNLIEEMNVSGGDVNKIAWQARTIRENVEAFELLQARLKPTIALCMGEAGLLSRVLAPKFGAFLTFAALHEGQVTAPGQPTLDDLKRLYRWDSIGAGTAVYGVVGSPVRHSMSPAIHNASFAERGVDGVYLPMLVDPPYESFKAFIEAMLALPALGLRGLSVTIPHKENALRYLNERGAAVDPLAERIGAVNTIVVEPDGRLRGFSSDYGAIVGTVTSAGGWSEADLAGKRVAVLGAGGTGRTATAAMAQLGATVVVYNRTFERARELAERFDGRGGRVVAARWERLCDSCCEVFINTTPLGMHPNVDDSPFDGVGRPEFAEGALVFDTIYNPARTRLLRQAADAGARTVGGIEMFIRQAAAQFEAWTARPAPTELMRRVIEARLGS